MAGEGRRTGRLAGRIVRITFLIGIVTVVGVGLMAVVGVSQFAAGQINERNTEYLHLAEDGVLGRLQSAEAVASRSGNAVANAPKAAAISERVAMIHEASSELVEAIMVVDVDGKVIASTPGTITAIPPGGVDAYTNALRGATGFTSAAGSDSATSALWLSRAVLISGETPAVILIRVNLDYVLAVVERSPERAGRSVIVMEGPRLLRSQGDISRLRMDKAVWEPVDLGSGHIAVPAQGGAGLHGYYSVLKGIEGVDWRVAVLDSDSRRALQTATAIAPSMLVLTVAGLVALFIAWTISRRLVVPLRELEAAAYRAANGSYVKPLSESRDDEIGQVAKAFNAVALRLNALHDLSQLLASASQLDQVLDGILSAMGHLVGPGTAAVYLLDGGGRWLVPLRVRGVDIAAVSSVDALADGWLATALTDTQPVVFTAGPGSIAEELPGLGEVGESALVAPLIAGLETLGVVVVVLDSGKETTQAEREMVRTFSAQAAVAVQNSRLFAVEIESRRVSDGLRRIAERLARPDGLSVTLHEIEQIVASLFSAESAAFAFVDRRALGLPAVADPRPDARLLGLALRKLAPGGPSAPVVAHLGEDADADEIITGSSAAHLLLVPVALDKPHGAVVGLTLSQEAGRRPDLELATSIANELALALENAFLYEQAVSRATNLETIFRISQAVGSSLQVNVVLNRVLDVVQKILSADALALMTYDQRRKTISTAMARGAVSPDLMDRVFSPADDVPGYVFTTGAPATYRDLREGMGGVAGDAASQGLRSLLAVPLLARGRSIGVLIVFSQQPGAFSDEDTNTLQTFASQAALAIDTARLYSREHEVASILQKSILPGALPEFDEVEAGSVYIPAGGEAEIGGDYYDLFRGGDGRIIFAIADVCGKGVVAATKTSMIKFSVRAFAAAGFTPGGILGEVNRMITESGEPSDIVTLWVGSFDPRDQVLTWASGGHPPGFVRGADEGRPSPLEATGPLLGALTDVVYGERTIRLNSGDTVLLYTDGVTEARSGNTFFGEERVSAALERGGSAEEVAQRLLVSVRRFARAELRDDLAVLVLRVRTPEEREQRAETMKGVEIGA